MKSAKSGKDNTKKKKQKRNNAMKVNKKTSMSSRRRNTDNGRTTKTRQQRVSKSKPSKRKQQQQELVIKRSSGRKENFDTNRMAQTVGRSGVPFLMARDVAKTVSNKIKHENYTQQQTKGRRSGNKSKPTQLKEKTVTANRIRNLVTSELRNRNRGDIAASYSGQTPENTLPEENLKDNQPTIADTSALRRLYGSVRAYRTYSSSNTHEDEKEESNEPDNDQDKDQLEEEEQEEETGETAAATINKVF
ncbi:MAG: hypothetical protein ACJ71I_13170 [Nitrososphaeraceae archaeon]